MTNRENYVKHSVERMVLNENNGILGMKYKVKGVIHDESKEKHKINFKIIINFYSINKLEV